MTQLDLDILTKYKETHQDCSWTPGETNVSRMVRNTPDVIKGLFGVPISFKTKLQASPIFTPAIGGLNQLQVLETKVDWRDRFDFNWVTPIKNQGTCGACVAFGTLAALESILMIHRFDKQAPSGDFIPINLSEAFLFYCLGNRKCQEGWFMEDAIRTVMESGVPTEDCVPYSDHGVDCDVLNWQEKIGDTKNIYFEYINGRGNILEMKRRLSEFGPQIAAMEIFEDFLYYQSGVYKKMDLPNHPNELQGYHCVCIVGYNDMLEGGCWICKNSWSDQWGEEGFFKIGYEECSILTFGFYTLIYSPQIPKKVISGINNIQNYYYFDALNEIAPNLEKMLRIAIEQKDTNLLNQLKTDIERIMKFEKGFTTQTQKSDDQQLLLIHSNSFLDNLLPILHEMYDFKLIIEECGHLISFLQSSLNQINR